MLLLDIVSTTSLDLPLQVPTLSEANLNFLDAGFDGLTIWLVQPYCELGISPLSIQRTVMFL